MPANKSLTNRLLQINDILCETYGAPFYYFSNKSPLDQLVSTLLSHRTRNKLTGKAYRTLREAFPTWEELLEAPVKEIESAIQGVTYAEQKAQRLPKILQYIKDFNDGVLSLDFIEDYSIVQSRLWLENISGVGAKTSAAVLNFSSLRLPALVVDSHHLRVAERLGLVPTKTTISKAAYQLQALLPNDWDGRQYYDHHEAMMYHGQKCCPYRQPECERCPVRYLCPYYQPLEEVITQTSLF